MKTKFHLLVAGLLLASIGTGFGQPVITNQPQTQATAPGTTVVFAVGATNTPAPSYQWQELGGNWTDLAGRTNATLALTNVQSWDAGDYRVVLTNINGAKTSAVARLYIMRFAPVSTNIFADNFDDNKITGWNLLLPSSGVGGRLSETNGQFTVYCSWPGVQTIYPWDTLQEGYINKNWSMAEGQTIEFRADLVALSENATNGTLFEAIQDWDHSYTFVKGRDYIRIGKYSSPTSIAFWCERAPIRNTNVVLSLALTRANPYVILTGRVLDKDNPNAVLYQHSFVDTPGVDPSFSQAQVKELTGCNWNQGPDVAGAPYTSGTAISIGFFQYTDGHQPAAQVTYDNFEIRKYDPVFTRYVDVNSTDATPPYTNWLTAATNIQQAVDAAAAGDEIVVTNGLYGTGGRAVSGTMTNRVAVAKPLTLRSVNGPQFTIIQGYQVPGITNGNGAIRCVYLTNGATLSGFTLTNGATRAVDDYPTYRESSGGGVWCESTNALVTNCIVAGNSADAYGGGSYYGTLHNCTLTGNSGTYVCGGGACGSTLNNCALSGNSAGEAGGGACGGTLNNCTLTGNSATSGGGGAFGGTLNNCTLAGNSAGSGGGAYGADYFPCTLNNCTLTGNSAYDGGGACGSTLKNCTLTGNSASYEGGGAWGGTLNNCTLIGNSAQSYGGGAYSDSWQRCTLNNCIVYFNTAPDGPNYYGSTMNYCCTTPQPANGAGNISVDPELASASHLSVFSPCRGAGSTAYTSGTDIDGEAWGTPPSIGCDEYHAGAVTGPLSVRVTATLTNVVRGFPVGLTAFIDGRADLSVWEFGDGFVQVNEPYTTHTWTALGDYLVALWVFNDSYPAGVRATLTIHVEEGLHYVAATSADPAAPYTSWATAATNIQDAVDVAPPGATIFVTNGIYGPVGVDKPLVLRSVNGPQATVIDGGRAVGCVYLTSGASLFGFTLTKGVADFGGGVCCESTSAVLSNCVLSGNSASYEGGGAFGATLNNCTLTGNSVIDGYGGGASESTLNNCTLTRNSATSQGGGASWSTLNNCIVYYNSANYDSYSTLNYCCTTPLPTSGMGNIRNAPLFVDYAGGNLRLQSNSPCINAGNNAYVVGSTDLDGRPRIVGGTVDIGAYEFQGAGMGEFIAWLQQYRLPTDGSADYTDADHDGMNNWQEWLCGTCPTNPLSALCLLSAVPVGTNVTVTWQSVAGVSYYLLRSTNLTSWPPFQLLATNLIGQAGTTSYTDTNAAVAPRLFYRVGVP